MSEPAFDPMAPAKARQQRRNRENQRRRAMAAVWLSVDSLDPGERVVVLKEALHEAVREWRQEQMTI